MSFLLKIFFFILTSTYLSEARLQKKPSAAVVVGTVYCDTCFQQDFSKASHFISGASVAVECKDGSSKEISFRKEVETDNHGEFKVQLPFSISKHVKKIEGCSVKLISSSEPYCAVASTATSSSLHLKSRKQGMHIFSAGFFTFKPLKQPNLCNQKPSIENSKGLNSNKAFLPPVGGLPFTPPIQDPTIPGLPPFQYLPPLPQLPPLPTLPPLPPLPGFPKFPPVQGKTSTESKPSIENSKGLNSNKASLPPVDGLPFTPPIQDPTIPGLPPFQYLPPLPQLPVPPLPTLPPLPPLPGFPKFPPVQGKTSTESKPSIENSKGLKSNKASLPPVDGLPFTPPIQDPTIPGLPPLPQLPVPPLPTLPPLPPLPGFPKLPPVQGKTSIESKPTETSSKKSQLSDKKVVHPEFFFPTPPVLPTNPFQQPPSILPPNPFQPPPLLPNPFQPPPLLPNPFQPTPAPLFPLPPIPGLTPSTPPPSLPFPFPPLFPFPPIIPRIPGTPPASSSSSKKTP